MNQAVTTEDLWKNLEEVIDPITSSSSASSATSNLNPSSDIGKVFIVYADAPYIFFSSLVTPH